MAWIILFLCGGKYGWWTKAQRADGLFIICGGWTEWREIVGG